MKKPPDDENSDLEDSFKAVKMTLNSICSNELLKRRINEFVLNANKIMFESYCLANLHVIKLIVFYFFEIFHFYIIIQVFRSKTTVKNF